MRSKVFLMTVIIIFVLPLINSDQGNLSLNFTRTECMLCCTRNLTDFYQTRNHSEWKSLRVRNVSLSFPECHGGSLCDHCIMRICCHSKRCLRQCPECRRSIDGEFYAKHNVSSPGSPSSFDDFSDSDEAEARAPNGFYDNWVLTMHILSELADRI